MRPARLPNVTADFSSQFAMSGGTLTFAIRNLADTDYYTYYSQTNPNDVRNFKGIGRSYSLGWRREF